VFAPNSKYRVDVTPAKRVFNIDVSVCKKCGGEARAIASIEDQPVIDKILAHLMKKGALPPPPSCCRQRGLTRYRLVCIVLDFTLIYTIQ
jgi:hypothetical protein